MCQILFGFVAKAGANNGFKTVFSYQGIFFRGKFSIATFLSKPLHVVVINLTVTTSCALGCIESERSGGGNACG
jgi:hypothetical protein